MKKEHMQHHYKNGTVGFGVTNKFWDTVFDTRVTEENMKIKKQWLIQITNEQFEPMMVILTLTITQNNKLST